VFNTEASPMPRVYRDVPPLREDPFAADRHDAKRVEYFKRFWHSQDAPLRLRDRQVEENIRMLAGQQWHTWSPFLNRFIDVSELVDSDQDRWMQRPVLNKLLYWFILTHARLTENPPILTFQPSTADRIDAELAEVNDVLFKTKWAETGMLEVLDRLVAQLIPGGRAHLKSRIDPSKGEIITFRGPGMLSLLGPDGHPIADGMGQPITREIDDAAYDREGNLLTQLFEDETGIGYGEPEGMRPHVERKGGLEVDALSCLEVRGTWGEQLPWHRKPWHAHRSFQSPEAVYDLFGLDVEPDIRGESAKDVGELQRVLMGSGWYGSAAGEPGAEFDGQLGHENSEYVSVYETWIAPNRFPGCEETEESPGGRLVIIAGDQVARDSVRPGRFKYTSPIRCFDFINLPGRPSGTSPQEMLNPAQRAFNRTSGQILNHAALCADPKAIIHESTGIDEGQWTNEPGEALIVSTAPGVDPVRYVAPPPLGDDAWRSQAFLAGFIAEAGNTEGAEGRPPTRDASGELVKELRFNSDRPIAATTRRASIELARMAEDWNVLLPLIMDEEEIIHHTGEDQVTRTVTVMRHLFEQGSVNVIADVESMLPEGRGERQQRIFTMYTQGIFGQPGSPEAVRQFMDLARFPHLSRAHRPGGIHRVTAEQENGKLVRGVPAAEIPVLEWYDDQTHLAVLEEFMASPEYLKLEPPIQMEFVIHRAEHQMAQLIKMEQAMAQQFAMEAAAASASQAVAPPPDKGDPNLTKPASDPKHLARSQGGDGPSREAVA
jgi:hypothetical protein